MDRRDTRMFNANKFKLGLFAINCSGGLSLTKAPERWDASWENNIKITQLAEAGRAGIRAADCALARISRRNGFARRFLGNIDLGQ